MQKSLIFIKHFFSILILSVFILSKFTYAQSTLDCSLCHADIHNHWVTSHHADTQNDVAGELAEEWAGLTPNSVIFGDDAEDCVACHSATSITANGGMTEVQTMEYFFSIDNGLYTESTVALHTDEWPHVACTTCHDVPADHPVSMPTLAIFNSPTAQYNPVTNVAELCGQCHGTLRYADTDHRRMDAWQTSKHGHGGQDDVAGELGEEWAGSAPADVIGEENCIACHASTSVLSNGGITEAEALNQFFTTEGGVFTENTGPQNTDLWPEVSCTSCHNQHNPDEIAYFNSETREYEALSSPGKKYEASSISQELCGKCHGNLRFPDTDHLSYNIALGTGGMGIDDLQTMPGIQCVDCHMHVGDADGTNAAMFGGHLWSTFIQEEDGSESSSCSSISCHPSLDADAAHLIVQGWQTEYADLVSTATQKVDDAVSAGNIDPTKLEEAQFNLAFAEGDESGGVHNHLYTMALLNDVIEKTTSTVGVDDNLNPILKEFALYQNYPNPFNPSTDIKFNLPEISTVKLEVFNISGERVATLLNKQENAGLHTVKFDASNLASGTYFFRIIAGEYQKTMKMILLR